MKTEELERFLDNYLESSEYEDDSLNGLQVEGTRDVKKVVLGVSASQALFAAAHKTGADAVLVHHGLLWRGADARVTGVLAGRVRCLLAWGMSLFAYHLPLDGHQRLGNNAVVNRLLGLKPGKPIVRYGGRHLSRIGTWPRAKSLAEAKDLVTRVVGPLKQSYDYGPRKVRRAAFVSGGAPKDVHEAAANGAELYITGDVSEGTQEICRELGVNFLAAGHYNSERFGVIELVALLKRKLKLEAEFIDIANRQ